MRKEDGAASAPRPGRAAKLALTLGAFVLGLVLVEVAVRVLDLGPEPEPVKIGGSLQSSDDPVLIFENRPGAVERIEYRTSRDAPPRTVEMHVNAQGFRGPVVAERKPAGTLRIACIGDSHTFGYGVADGETWPARLEELLRARFPARAMEVLNCGVDAYDTLQEVRWMQRRVLAFEPDLVILQYYVNDTAVRGEGEPPPESDWLFDLAHPRRAGWVRTLRERSRFADLVLDGVYRRRGLGLYAQMRMQGYAPASAGWRRVVEGLRTARDALAARGAGFAVVLYPFLVREGDHLTSHDAFALVRALCTQERIACFDAEPAFASTDVDRLRISPHDYHGNPDANAIFAQAVADWLVVQGLVTP